MSIKIICAIDNSDFGYSYSLASSISKYTHAIKLGLEFFTSCGPSGVEKMAALNLPIFLDLKLHDIPNTVAKTVEVIREMKCVSFLTLHITGGREMLLAARKSLNGTKTLLIGVSVLTSLLQDDLKDNGIDIPLPEYVKKLALFGKECGLDGVVCSTQEADIIRRACGEKFIIITPGIASNYSSDQRRLNPISSLRETLSNYLVIGRAITSAPDPEKAARDIFFFLTK